MPPVSKTDFNANTTLLATSGLVTRNLTPTSSRIKVTFGKKPEEANAYASGKGVKIQTDFADGSFGIYVPASYTTARPILYLKINSEGEQND